MLCKVAGYDSPIEAQGRVLELKDEGKFSQAIDITYLVEIYVGRFLGGRIKLKTIKSWVSEMEGPEENWSDEVWQNFYYAMRGCDPDFDHEQDRQATVDEYKKGFVDLYLSL